MLVIGILGTVLRTKLQLDVAEFLMRFLKFVPFVVATMMTLNGYLSYLYLEDAFDRSGAKISESKKILSYVILLIITLIMILLQVGGCMIIKRVHISFK
jgi:hypothetical protein